ncbi:adhesion G protein-coupled receptor G3 isoform X2 [Pelodiscus sinensis]|uniref:adhesion G protein-coupled receptor G3 isoform X2 n=1 Tax=Pelodiscus sinensis TaxID=13735 RepID=UPI003F6CCAA0
MRDGRMVTLPHTMKYSFLMTALSFLLLLGVDAGTKCCGFCEPGKDLPVTPECARKIMSINYTCVEQEQEQTQKKNDTSCACLQDKLHRFWLAFEDYLTKEEAHEDIVDMSRMKARVQNISTSLDQDLLFTLAPNEVPREGNASVRGHVSSVKLPQGIFQSLHNKTDHVKVAIMVLNVEQWGLFKDPDQTGTMLDNVMVSVNVGDRETAAFNNCMELTFSHSPLPLDTARHCVFWDPKKGLRGGWNTSGCLTDCRERETVCCCDHLTFFTLLLNPSLDAFTAQRLSTIAKVGCGISMGFSVLTVGLYFVLRCAYKNFLSDNLVNIHMNLMSSLLLLNLAYLLNSWIVRLDRPGLCKGIGGVTHYGLLCCFTWMAIEAFQLYLLAIKVTNTYMRHYLVKLCLVGWGFPALVVTIAGSMNSYGQYAIKDAANQTTVTLCWIDAGHALVHYITNCSYFGLILLANMLVLGAVVWKLCGLRRTTAGKEAKIEAWKGGLTVLGLSCLLGATWGLAFFTYGTMSVPALYLFTVLNSLQGLFIFIWFAVLYYPKRDTAAASFGTGRNEKVTTASHS